MNLRLAATFVTYSLTLSACGSMHVREIPKKNGANNPAEVLLFNPPELEDNPNCKNPVPLDAWNGLDQQRISEQEFFDAHPGTYSAHLIDWYVETLGSESNNSAFHARLYMEDRTERNAQTQKSLICRHGPTLAQLDLALSVPDVLNKAQGQYTDLWKVIARHFGDNLEWSTDRDAEKSFPDEAQAQNWKVYYFKRDESQYEIRLLMSSSIMDQYVRVIYLLQP